LFTSGTPFTLSATATGYSVFNGWSGACAGTGSCGLTADADKNVTATFAIDTAHKARIGTTNYFSTLSLAYAGASSVGNVEIDAWGTAFDESLLCDGTKNVTIKGGYNADYSSNSGGYTTLNGALTIRHGSVTAEKLIIH
jgi:hypothetical protein